uniref:Serpentine Receptor, class T n=1 Tax=Panagrellus redivivus TaxID=6233 RepID=A0A7E5A1J7_PANRE
MISSFLNGVNSLFPTVNYSSITFDDLESPRLVAAYVVFWDVSLVLTTIFFSFMLYMIITKSPREMSDYKWYLVHQLTWSYLFDLYVGLWKPVPLWPFYIGYSAGIFSNVGGNSVTIQLLIVVVNAIGMGFGVCISILHRYMQGSPFSFMYKLYSYLWFRFSAYVLAFVVLLGLLFLPLSLSFSLQTELEVSLTSKYPELVRIFELHPSMFGYDTDIVEYSVGYAFLIVSVLLVVIIVTIILYFNFARILKRNKTHLSSGTYKLQVMLFRTLFIQMLLAGVLLFLPITLCFILTLFGFRWISSFTLLAISFLGTHAIADFVVLCYFVRAYRTYIQGLFRKMWQKLNGTVIEKPQLFVSCSSVVLKH